MNRKVLLLYVGILNTLTLCFTILIFVFSAKSTPTVLISPVPYAYSPNTVRVLGTAVYAASPLNLVQFAQKPINVLLLGFDGRRGDKNPRCDAIHLINIDIPAGKIRINSIPRGTAVAIPNTSAAAAYLSNSCHIMGIDFAEKEIEKITNLHPDYLVKVGFSQTLGILRTVGLPTTPTLQFLRNRRYGVGDNQRSRNQGLFIKDMLLAHLEEYSKLPKPIKYLVYKMTDTDIDFETADNIISQIIGKEILKNPENIELKTYLPQKVKVRDIDYAVDETSTNQWQTDTEFQQYQSDLSVYLDNLIERGDNFLSSSRKENAYQIIKTPFAQKLWLQIEDDNKRNQFYYDLLRLFVFTSPDKSTVNSLVLDFITEMETNEQTALKEKGDKLLNTLNTT
jgi:anionic cell wall polymer biosynthesis LytR-Cps2A-Psr (LCP) family protein